MSYLDNGIFVYSIISESEKTAALGYTTLDVDGNAFVETTEITGKIIIPDYINGYRIIRLSTYAFRYCDKITELTLPSTLVELEDASLSTLLSIKKLVIPASVTKIGNRIDYFSSMTHFKFAEGSRIESIGDYFLQHCESLEYFELPSSVKSLGNYLLHSSTKLKTFAYCGVTDFSTVTESFQENNIIKEVIVSLEYPSNKFSHLAVNKKTFQECHTPIKCRTCLHNNKITIKFIIIIIILIEINNS